MTKLKIEITPLDEQIRDIINDTVLVLGRNQSEAARRLKISRGCLRAYLNEDLKPGFPGRRKTHG